MTFVRVQEASSQIFAFVALLVACTGCPGSGSDNNGTGSAGSNATNSSGASGAKACARISASEVSATLGIAPLMDPTADVNEIVTNCKYAQGSNPLKVQIRYQAPTTPSEFALGKQGFTDNGFTTSDVSDIGDMAYWSSIGDVITLDFLSNTTEITLVAAAPLDKLKALANQLIPKL